MTLLSFKSINPEGAPCRDDDRAKEKLFLDCYSWLIECALNMTHGQRERAEDLVHDVFVRFLDNDTEIASIGDVRGYLNGMLRNLHLLQLRRTTRHPLQSLTLIDHDSALVGLRTWNSVEQLHAADLLLRACDFVCYRKEATLSSSILILRFFHGFYPGEICRLVDAKRKSVDKWIERGRSETKQYLASPYPLPDSAKSDVKSIPGSASAFLRCLRERIFDSCTSDCSVLPRDADELGVREVAHLVGCSTCLGRRSREMRLAHVAERMADDISDRDDGRPEGGSGGSGDILSLHPRRKPSKRAILRNVYARRKELFEHRPKELSLAFDGVPHATLLVNAATSTLNISLDSEEVPNSVAILSEQEFNFLLLDRGDLTGRERRVRHLELSEGRSLDVTITPGTLGPSIQVVYLDPSLSTEVCAIAEDEPRTISVRDRPVEVPFRFAGTTTDSRPAWRTLPVGKFRSWLSATTVAIAGAVLLVVAALLCFVLWPRGGAVLSTAELLDRAQKSDRGATTPNRPGVIYEKVAIRTPHRTVERTIYRDAQGGRRPRKQSLSPEDEQLKDKLARAGVNWDAPLSSVDFAAWRQRSSPTRDSVKRTGEHLLTLSTAPITSHEVVKETLTVRDTDFQGVDRTVELRDTGTVEIAQLNYDVLPWGAVNPDWFEPLPPQAVGDAPGILTSHTNSASELELETELAVRYALHKIGADLGEPIEIRPGREGAASVSVVGVVASAERRQQLLTALSGIPSVATRFRTEQEAVPGELRGTVRRAEPLIVTVHSPIEKELLDYFGNSASVEDISKRMIGGAGDLVAHAWALRHLEERYGLTRTRAQVALSPASGQLLQAMLRDHYRAMADETSELTASLGPMLRGIVRADPEPALRLPVFDGAQQIQRLTLELVSGSGSSGTRVSEPAKSAEDLLAALRGLEFTLGEQP